MKSLLQQQLKLWVFPVIVLLAVNYIYFFPVLQGDVITQDDIMMGKAKGKEIRDYREATGEEPLWTNSMFSGMPTFQISTEYPNNWLNPCFKRRCALLEVLLPAFILLQP
jgi:hypothetical protein